MVTALFYATPVLYPIDIVPARLRDLVALNPLAPLFELARKWVIDPDAPGPVAASNGASRCWCRWRCSSGMCVLAVWVFRREAPRIAEEL